MQKLIAALGGISGILVTPFDAGDRLAPQRLGPIVDRAVGAGVHLLVANGNTGEFYSLSTDEAVAMVEAAAGHVAGRAPLLCGVGRALPDALRLARAARAAGADGLMVHQPPDPFVAPRGVVDYLRRVGEAGDGLPLVLYLRNDAMGTAAIAELCAVEGVVAVKWATPNPMRLAEAAAAADPRIAWVAGLAETWAPVALRRRRPRLHLGADQRLARAVDGDPRRPRRRGLRRRRAAHRRDERLRGDPRRGDERRQRHRGEGGAGAARASTAAPPARPRPGRSPRRQSRRLRAFMEASGLLRVAA